MIHWENINPISQELWIYMCLWFLILFSHLGKKCEYLSHGSPLVYRLKTSQSQLRSLWLRPDTFFGHKKAPGNHFTSGVLICRGQWVQKQVKRANFAQNRKFLPIFPDPFSEQSETLLVRPFCPIWYFLYRLFLTFSLRIEWACVLVFVERFLV